MKVLSEECSCENMPRKDDDNYQLLDTNCRVLHDIEGEGLPDGDGTWHYVVISAGSRTHADTVRRELIKQSNIIKQLKIHYNDATPKHRDHCSICIYIAGILRDNK